MKEKSWTRREFAASAAIAGTISALESATAQTHRKNLPGEPSEVPVARRVSLDDDWRFTRGDVAGAEPEGFPAAHGLVSICRPTGASQSRPEAAYNPSNSALRLHSTASVSRRISATGDHEEHTAPTSHN